MAGQSIRERPSTTAVYVCFSRACAAREPDERFRGPDTLAEPLFVPCRFKLLLAIPPLCRYGNRKTGGGYEYVMARTRLFDAVFSDALADYVPQIVILGAGFDTRALRFAGANRSTRIIECDAPTTQQAKIDILRRKKVPLPPGLAFAPIDFTTQKLGDALAAAGYVENQKTLFLWEGVAEYLDAQAVDRTLEFVHDSAAEGSIIVFDTIYASVVRQEHRYYGEQISYDQVAKAGEPWTFGIEEGAIDEFMAARGFEIVSLHTADELQRRYLTAEDGTLFGRVNGSHFIVVARTTRP